MFIALYTKSAATEIHQDNNSKKKIINNIKKDDKLSINALFFNRINLFCDRISKILFLTASSIKNNLCNKFNLEISNPFFSKKNDVTTITHIDTINRIGYKMTNISSIISFIRTFLMCYLHL